MSIQRFLSRSPMVALSVASVLILMSVFAVLVQPHSAISPESRDSEFWLYRFDEINRRIVQGNIDLLFIGDSITHFFEGTIYPIDSQPHPSAGQAVWNEYYAERNAVNIGIGGDRTEHVLWRLDHGNVTGISPKLSVLMIGANNGRDNSSQEIADGIVAIVENLLIKFPESKILLLAIFPQEAEPNALRSKLAHASELAAGRIADGDKVHYMDINSRFLTANGVLPIDVMPDGIHPNEKGYRIWAEAIEPKVKELLVE